MAFRIHFAALAVLAGLYLHFTWDAWFPPPDQGFNLDGLGAALLLLMLLLYAAVTTIVAGFCARRPLVVAVLHALGIAGFLVFVALDQREEHARMAAPASTPPRTCVRVLNVHVRPTNPLRGELVLQNDCATTVIVDGADLWGFFPDGNDALLAPLGWSATLLPDHTARVLLDARIAREALPSLATWSWRLNLSFDASLDDVCLVTPGASDRHCEPLVPVTIDAP